MTESTRRKLTVIAFAFVLIVAAALGLFLALQDSLTGRDAAATTVAGGLDYNSGPLGLAAIGDVLGNRRYLASSENQPYAPATYNVLTTGKFTGTNLPSGANLEYCIMRRDIESELALPVYCEGRSTGGASSTWEFGGRKLLVTADQNYYCNVVLTLPSQSAISDLGVEGSQFSCELEFAEIAGTGAENFELSIASPALSASIAGDLQPRELSYTAQTGFRILEANVNLLGEPGIPSQNFGEVCLSISSQSEPICGSNFNYSSDFPTSYSFSNSDLRTTAIAAGDRFSFSCATAEGRVGDCHWNLIIQLIGDGAGLSDVLTGVASYTPRNFFTVGSATAASYCRNGGLILDQQLIEYLPLTTVSDSTPQEACIDILSSSKF